MKSTTGAEETALSIAWRVWSDRRRRWERVRVEEIGWRRRMGLAADGRRACIHKISRLLSVLRERLSVHTLVIVLENMMCSASRYFVEERKRGFRGAVASIFLIAKRYGNSPEAK
jgi:hypothetical protein